MTIRGNIAIVGAGLGGLALAGLLSRRGFRVRVYEQARAFQRIGAGIQMSPHAVVGADGVHSRVREFLLGAEKRRFTGRVAHRTVFPTAQMDGFSLDTCTKWWGPDRHIVMCPVTAARDETYFVTSVPDPDWDVESWSTEGDMDEVHRAPAGFHPDVQRVLGACRGPQVGAVRARSAALLVAGADRSPGGCLSPDDAYMARGGASALEDAAMLARCLEAAGDPEMAFRSYAAMRLPRTTRLRIDLAREHLGHARN
jgi:6-hydroxynicotinate 3-monooxygenase